MTQAIIGFPEINRNTAAYRQHIKKGFAPKPVGWALTLPVPAGIVIHQPDIAVLGRLLSRLEPGRRLFIFVNGPLDEPSSALLAQMPGATLIRSAVNIGLGAGLNAIAAAAISESFSHLMLFDQDSEPSAALPEQLLARWEAETARGTRLAVVGPLLVPPAQGHYRQIRYSWRSAPAWKHLAPANFVPTSGSLLDLAAFKAIGPFRDDFFIGGIDVEWGFRAWSRGYGLAVARDLTMLHRWGEAAAPDDAGTPQILRHSRVRKYYYIRNAVFSLGLPFIPRSWRLRFAFRLCAQIGYLLLYGQGLRQLDTVIFRALRDGMVGRLGPMRFDLPNDTPLRFELSRSFSLHRFPDDPSLATAPLLDEEPRRDRLQSADTLAMVRGADLPTHLA